ncbi:hypothetical protein EYE42_12795 [Paracoccus subflavus]|uniref:Uncharacterized protein n=1 Tax=Paracoccus subflavus TaxID=2528244 RepID=A0A4Q9FYT0_9RHOB|nr:hypothetical protein [Paracoccus subflavus]TBN38302.1 hypothetical protein EYE42_12795 [Paracoccus subflavus]
MKPLVTAVFPLLAAACAPLPPLDLSVPAAADAAGPVSIAPSGPSVDYTPRQVAEPADWTTLNSRQIGGVE